MAGSGKVHGQTVEVTLEGVMSVFRRRMRDLLDDHGIEDPDPQSDDWYDMEAFLNVLDDVKEDTGENALRKIGEATPRQFDWPDEPDSPAAALAALSDIYEAEHQPARGSYAFERVDDTTARVTADTPYPCVFDRGLLKGTVKTGGGNRASLTEVGSTCRDEGHETCVYELSW